MAVIAMVIVFAVAIGLCLIALRRRGPGELGALERGAAQQEFARGLALTSTPGQAMGISGS
ncbi:hypothetical protein [Streptomyces sp. NPDC054842]